MFSALLFLQAASVRNRLRYRLSRLKQPKYLLGAIVGGLYFYFYFFRYLLFPHGRIQLQASSSPWLAQLEPLGALLLLLVVVGAWFFPHARAALVFSEAEIAFLFPAPVTRRTLIHFKLLRSQLRIWLTVFFLTLFSMRAGGPVWTRAVGWWLILSTLNLHFLGCSFARTFLLDKGLSNLWRRLLVLVLVVSIGLWIGLWTKSSLPDFGSVDFFSLQSLSDYLNALFHAGPAPYLLWPFRMLVRPFLAPDGSAFFSSLPAAVLLMGLHYAWVVYSDTAFEEASLTASRQTAERLVALRSGNWQTASRSPRARRPWFALKASTPPALAILWKNLISTGQVASWRLVLPLVVACIAMGAVSLNFSRHGNYATLAALLLLMLLTWSLLLGAQVLRQDFRQDLPLVDVLKTYPLPAWQIALGEVLAPWSLIVLVQGVLLLLLAVTIPYLQVKDHSLLWALLLGAALLLPGLDGLVLLIPNATVLLLPSWVQTGREAPGGIEATGQRLVLMLGQMLLLLLALLPAALGFAAVFFALRLGLGLSLSLAIPPGCVAAALGLFLEWGLGLLLLGKCFNHLDLGSEKAG